MNDATELDDVRYEHHVRHRGQMNHRLFWCIWFLVTAILFVKLLRRVQSWWIRRWHRKHRYVRSHARKSTNRIERLFTYLEAISLSPLPSVARLTPINLSVGKCFVIIAHIIVVMILLTFVDAPVLSSHFLEDMAFRAAWVTLSQIPLVYLLSAKRGPLVLLAALSYERINWLHRWIGRTLFISATVHVVIMKSSISMQDILSSHEAGMSVVRYGIVAYTCLIWIALSSVLPLRKWSHRAFYFNHWASTLMFLIIALQHVPRYARTPIYISVSILTLDKLLVAYYFFCNNLTIQESEHRYNRFSRGSERAELLMGYPVKMTTPSILVSGLPTQTKSEATVVRISNVPFTWKAGQHFRLYIPALGRFEMHPFTPANCSVMRPPPLPPRKDVESAMGRVLRKQPAPTSEMLFMVKEKSGFTKRLADYQREWLARPCPNASQPSTDLTAYLDGPYGNTPSWEGYECLVLLSSGTGVSFTLAILDHLEQLCFTGSSDVLTKTVKFIWITRHLDPQFETTVKDFLIRYRPILAEMNIDLCAEFHTTCLSSQICSEPVHYDPFAHLRHSTHKPLGSRPSLKIRHPDDVYEEWQREAEEMIPTDEEASPFMVGTAGYHTYVENESDNSDETCVDEQERRHSGEKWEVDDDDDDNDPFSDQNAVSGIDAAYRPLPVPAQAKQASTPEQVQEKDEGCKCAIIQYQRRKLMGSKQDAGPWIEQNYGVRPDTRSILEASLDSGTVGKALVALCANEHIARDARSVVARANFTYARGRRRSMVNIFIGSGF